MFSWRLLGIAGGLIVLALLAGSLLNQQIGGLGSSSGADPVDPSVATVVKVIDGDTIRVRFLSGATRRVRYIGIDTPEAQPETECFAEQATAANRRLVGGRKVRIRFDRERKDQYGRLLAYVYLTSDDRPLVNRILLARGYATPLTIPPNTHFAKDFRAAAAQAREERLGLWSRCAREAETLR